MRFVARALDASQRVHTFTLDAADGQDARNQLVSRQLVVLSVASRNDRWPGGPALPLLLFTQELVALLEAGLPVMDALETLRETAPDAQRSAVLDQLIQRLRDGRSLSDALRGQPAVFPVLFVGIVQAAEGSGELPQSLARYAAYEQRLDRLRATVVTAVLYPAILMGVGTCVGAFLVGYVVPRFATVYRSAGHPLPAASAALLAIGDFLQAHGVEMALMLAVASGFLVRALRRQGPGRWWRLLGLVPTAGAQLRLMDRARLYLTLGMLLDAGLPLPRGLELCETMLGAADRARLGQVRRAVESGHSLSDALLAAQLGTPVALRLLRVGEQSGALATMLGRAAAFHEEAATRWIERFSKTFEPVLMALIGVVIGLIVVLLYMPIFDLAGSLG